jgi:hypothetical protein
MGRPSAARVSGPLRPLARGFLVDLLERGYAWTAVAARLRLMAELSSWLAARGLGPRELTPSLVEEFWSLRALLSEGSRGARRRRSGSCWPTCAGWE